MGSASGGAPPRGSSRGAVAVGAGILASRLAGLARVSATAAAFGVSPLADVFVVALRAPNVLQNLLGEQALSASFIPVYSRLLAKGERDSARRLAGTAFGLLAVASVLLVTIGVLAARPIVAFFSPGYLLDPEVAGEHSRFELAVAAVRWIFPMTGVLVLSAWALGVLNSHRRFFLPYAAPVVWNLSIVGALFGVSVTAPAGLGAAALGERLLLGACAGAVVGAVLQLLIQLPAALRSNGGLRLGLSLETPGVKPMLTALGPALLGRGVVQFSAYLDLVLASFLVAGAQGALGYAQQIYLLPISLFGSSVAAAALPELARASAEAGQEETGTRTRAHLGRLQLLAAPSAALFAFLGLPLVAGLYRLLPGSRFGEGDVHFVALLLALYALGLPASAASRLLQNSFFALGDTKTPARVAAGRFALGASVSIPLMLLLDRHRLSELPWVGTLDTDPALGAAGLALGAATGAWFERLRLRSILRGRIGEHDESGATRGRIWAAALVALGPAIAIQPLVSDIHPTVLAACVGVVYLSSFLIAGLALDLPEFRLRWRRLVRSG